MTAFSIDRRRRPAREISMIPLINVVFLLLIFFLIAGSIERSSLIPLQLPEANGGAYLEEGPIEIVLGYHDEVVVNNALVSLETLGSMLVRVLEANRHAVITVKSDARLPAERLIRVMNTIKRAGGINISLVTATSS